MTWGKVTDGPDWDDRPLFIVGGGPSLKGRGLTRLRDRGRVLGVNKAAAHVPCDATFTQDRLFLEEYADVLRVWARTQEVFAAVPESWFDGHAAIPNVTYLKRAPAGPGTGYTYDPKTIENGLNSGYGALVLGCKKMAPVVFLLGYDLNEFGHWHEGYEWGNGSSEKYYGRWALRFGPVAQRALQDGGPFIVNCNPRSAVKAFPFVPYESIGL